jgi:hypothetical protein
MNRSCAGVALMLLGAVVVQQAAAQEAPAAAAAATVAHATPAPAVAPQPPAATPGPRAGDRAVDRLQLDATAITGNRELPKVMSIVPWKAAEPPAGPDRPMGSLIDELLAPLDRDEFRREITYYRDLTSQSSTPTTVAAPGAK